MYLKDIIKCPIKGRKQVETAEGKRKEELDTEFKTLNDREKDYILGLTRALCSAVKKTAAVSKPRKPKSRKRRGLHGIARTET